MVNQAQIATVTQLVDAAKTIGLETKAALDTFAQASKTRRDAFSAARESVEQDRQLDEQKGVQAFNAPRITNLAKLGQTFGRLFNDSDSKHAKESAKMAATSYMEAATGRGEKSLNGGVLGNYAYMILCGANADRVRRALQDRLDHWQAHKEASAALTDAKLRAEGIAEAMRYLQPAGQAPDVKGNPIVVDGVVKTPKHNGRPARKIRGIQIDKGGATNRDSQIGQFAKMFLHHGDAVLDSEFVDAWLDNGGKWEGNSDTPEAHANAALASIEKLLLAGGATSADSANLTAMRMFLSRIATEGLTKNASADPTPPAPAAPTAAPIVKVGDETQVDAPAPAVPPAPDAELDAAVETLLTAPPPAVAESEPAAETAPVTPPAPSRKVRRAAVNATRPGM